PPPRIHGCGNRSDGCRRGVFWSSKVRCGGHRMVGAASHVVVYPETGCATTHATVVASRSVRQLSHRER
ncbi:MAG TPA: hypothetical protein VNT24_03435, partial [Propionibacteriaceae bacterium]|nr:hypothetical protein [Propionibacteriaceae bacterium]